MMPDVLHDNTPFGKKISSIYVTIVAITGVFPDLSVSLLRILQRRECLFQQLALAGEERHCFTQWRKIESVL
jgi:hypothetical protein